MFPSRLHNSETVFRPLTVSTAQRVLTNPRYAGAYAYGRRQVRRSIDGRKTVRAEASTTGWPAFPMLIPAISAGSSISRT